MNHIAAIEHDIAKLLTEYFCRDDSEKQLLFFEQIACRQSLEEKRKLLIAIVKADYPSFWEERSQFLKDIQELQSFRNKLAHSILDVSEEALARPLEAGVGFIQWNKGAPVTERELDDWCVRANMVSGTLADIKQLLPFKESK